ncbi:MULTISPECIES: ScbA/BarX family gamma-butyrolactone biosynthesis protein [unclassified Streptomyces]|uniref:ScbA/BarX family gamma-butyrolactone biosynthesis protein n=1 Tax=unclassified Streptomyces TaxID=2593676 RepID=UPI002F9135DE
MTAAATQLAHPLTNEAPVRDGQTAPAIPPPLFRFPSLTTTVPKEFVHRAAVAEVILTDWKREDDTHFKVTAQWPRGHSFFSPIDGHHDPLLAAETIRQVGSLLAHAEFGVPLGHQFLMWGLEYAVEPDQILIGDTPAALGIDVICTEVKWRGGTLAGLRYEAVIHRDGKPAVRGSASYTCTTPAVYRRLRGGRCTPEGPSQLPLTAPVSPRSVGRMSPVDVVLAPSRGTNRWQLRADTRHHVLFDHPVDHVPGMVLLEAARQAAAAALRSPTMLPIGISSEFHRYAELDTPCRIQAQHLPGTADGVNSVLVTGHQDGNLVFTSTVKALSPES